MGAILTKKSRAHSVVVNHLQEQRVEPRYDVWTLPENPPLLEIVLPKQHKESTEQVILVTQATKGIDEVFQQLVNFDIDSLNKFEEYLQTQFGKIEIDKLHTISMSKSDKLCLRLPDKSYEMFEVVYAGLEQSKYWHPESKCKSDCGKPKNHQAIKPGGYNFHYLQIQDERDNIGFPYAGGYRCNFDYEKPHKHQAIKPGVEKEISNKLLKFALSELFECQLKETDLHKNEAFDRLLSSRNLKIIDIGEKGICNSLKVAIGECMDKAKLFTEVKQCPIDRSEFGSYGDNSNSQFGGYGGNSNSQFGGYGGNSNSQFGGYGGNSNSQFGGYGGNGNSQFGGYGENSTSQFGGYGGNSNSQFGGYGENSNSQFGGYGENSNSQFGGYGGKSNSQFGGYRGKSNSQFGGYRGKSNSQFGGYRGKSNSQFGVYGRKSNSQFGGYRGKSNSQFGGYGGNSNSQFGGYGGYSHSQEDFDEYGGNSHSHEDFDGYGGNNNSQFDGYGGNNNSQFGGYGGNSHSQEDFDGYGGNNNSQFGGYGGKSHSQEDFDGYGGNNNSQFGGYGGKSHSQEDFDGYGGNNNSQFGGYGGKSHSQEDEDPFLFYAASIYYQLHIHVISAVKGEEYVFYPSDLPSKRAFCGHIFIAHLSGKEYCCLENVKEDIPPSLPLTIIGIGCGTIFTDFAISSNQFDILKCLKFNENVFCEKDGKTYPHRRSTIELINQFMPETNGSKIEQWLYIEDLTTDVVSRCVNEIKKEINQKFQGRLKNIQYVVVLPISRDNATKMRFIEEIELEAKISRDSLSVVTRHEAVNYFCFEYSGRYYEDGGDVSVLRGAIQMIKDKIDKEKELKENFKKKLIQMEAKIELQEIKSFQEIIQKKHSYDLEGEVEVKPEILENGLGINTGDKLSFKEAVKDDIDKDTNDINEMVLSAKHGLWEEVWKKLKQKPYIVNCIPEGRAWSALHQAIFLGNLEAVKKLVEDFEADPGCYTKPDIANVANPGTDAVSLAQQLGKNEIHDYLMHYFAISHLAKKSQDINFVKHRNGKLYPFQKHPLLKITMASYKSIFSSDDYPCGDQMEHLSIITDGIFQTSDAVWKDAAVKIYHTLYGIERRQTENLLNSQSKEEFFGKLVRLYTGNSIYPFLTPALSRQRKTPFKPLAIDLSVAPFALTLTAVLMYWEDIEPFGGVTYRGVSSNVVDQYTAGETLMFLSFISSSKLRSEAQKFAKDPGTLFIIHNTADKTWQPRFIKKYSLFDFEEECLYPLGAEFFVDFVDKTKREVTLTLLNSTVQK